MPLACICNYLKSVLKYKYLILDTCHPDALYLRKQGCKKPCLFFESTRSPQSKKVWKKTDVH